MARTPRIVLEMDGLDDLRIAIERANEQLTQLRETLNAINVMQMSLQVKINQPSAATDD